MRILLVVITILSTACGADTSGIDYQGADAGQYNQTDARDPLDPPSDSGPGDSDAGEASCQANLMFDKNNCGFCGHVCPQTSCTNGFCIDTSSSSRYPLIAGPITDNTGTYFTAEQPDGRFATIRHPGSGGDITLATVRGLTLPRQVALDLGNIYHTDTITSPEIIGRIRKTSKAGGATIIANFQPSTMGAITHSDGTTYWATEDYGIRMIVNGTQQVILLDSTVGETRFITHDDAHIYWVASGSIGRTAKDGSSSIVLSAGGASRSRQIAVDSTHVYWKDYEGNVVRIPKDGGTLEVIASGQDVTPNYDLDTTNSAIFVSDGVVYWGAGGKLQAKPIEGGSIQTLADVSQGNPSCAESGAIEEISGNSSLIFFSVAWDNQCSKDAMSIRRTAKY